jgi:hypothetical protein
MVSCDALEEPEGRVAGIGHTCPRWCVTEHGVQLGEEDWIHTSQPVKVADGLEARMCLSTDPDTGIEDGPHVLIGSSELTPDEARTIGELLILLASAQDEEPPQR